MEAGVFQPDDQYCAYCHAPAAGPCAECGALCCGECVEVVLLLTSRRAICKSCLESNPRAGGTTWRWIFAAAVGLIAVIALLYRVAG